MLLYQAIWNALWVNSRDKIWTQSSKAVSLCIQPFFGNSCDDTGTMQYWPQHFPWTIFMQKREFAVWATISLSLKKISYPEQDTPVLPHLCLSGVLKPMNAIFKLSFWLTSWFEFWLLFYISDYQIIRSWDIEHWVPFFWVLLIFISFLVINDRK